ncbi:DNA cytosine methyltransferase [Pedobacter sp. HMWF019]|uniref:DNA cytosine methyltransferase n=1 Tax=Pedobacter sp. HMWF019 TaxID=2056856 RepID=UPI001304DD27|nr:DNA cytosine methyltransferase [Pedobacter sp. HMWF019]
MKHGSLFSGIGGFDLAAHRMGWNNVFHVEKEDYQNSILKKHFPKSKQYGDIKTFEAKQYGGGKIDILSGGFPCQDISAANFKSIGIVGNRSSLWGEYARIIYEIRPRFVIIENSPNLLKKGFEKILHDLSEIGYDAEWECFTAEAFGYPHKRERIYIIAYPNGFRQQRSGYIFENVRYNQESKDWETNRVINAIQRKTLPPLCKSNHGFPTQLALTGLGNAIVPEIAYQIFQAIIRFEAVNNSI